ncbi:MAG: ATP-binding cassette domain-containing protein [bacterium]|nr:ATP-binding cassette domain-containing protein [bacterium]
MIGFDVDIKKSFPKGRGEAFSLDAAFSIPEGKITVIFGPSGSGKSTILRLLAGLEKGEHGRIQNSGKTWFDSAKGLDLSPKDRKTGYLFQDLALFPHLSVMQNILYTAGKRNLAKAEELLEMTQLGGLKDSSPDELSGGERQRLALARALAGSPDLLLLDEPFSALDRELKKKLYDELTKLHFSLGFTAVMVTHDMAEAYRLAEHAVILNKGRVTKEGPPEEVFLGKSLSTRIQLYAQVIAMESDEIHTLLTVKEGIRTFRVFVDNEEAGKIEIGDEVIVAAKASDALVFKV